MSSVVDFGLTLHKQMEEKLEGGKSLEVVFLFRGPVRKTLRYNN